MSYRARIALGGAALIGPLAALPTLRQPQLAIALCIVVGVGVLASKSIAYPLGLWALPGVAIAIIGGNPFPNKTVEIFLVGWLLLGILFTLFREQNALPLRLVVSGPVLMTLGLTVVMVGRLGASTDPSYGSYKLQLFVAESLTFLLAGILVARSRRHMNLWVAMLLVSVGAGALLLLQDLLTGKATQVLPGRLALYAQADPIALARGAATGLLLAVFLLLGSPVAWRRAAALALIPILGIAFIGAGSRGPVLGMVAGLVILLGLSFGDRVSRKRMLLLAVALGLSVVIIPQLVPGQNLSRSLSILTGGGQDAGGGDVSNGRYQIYSEAWKAFGNHPFTGIGTGSFASTDPVAIYPHNIFLEVASELGFPGLLLLCGIIGLAFVHVARAWRRSQGEDRHHAALVAAYLGAAVVNAQFSADLARNGVIWLGAGLAFGLVQRVSPTPEQEPLGRLRTRWRRRGSGAPEPIDQRGAPRQQLPPPLPHRRTAPARPATAGGEIVSPAGGGFVCGEVVVSCRPGGAGWTIGSVAIERSHDGREWIEIGETSADQDFEIFVLMPGGGRRQVAVLRSKQRAEEMRAALAGEHGVTVQQIEVRPAKRTRWGSGDTRELTWDTREVADGGLMLRSLTTDVTGRQLAGPEIAVTIDNEPPSIHLESPRQGAVLMGVVEVSANARDEGSGVALTRFEVSPGGDDWAEIATVGTSPYRTNWNTGLLGEGDYQLRAIALDRAGNEVVSRAVAVRVERVVAAVKLEDPGECLSRTVRMQASVRDEAKIAGVEFQVAVADTFAWHALGAVSQPPFEIDLDTARLQDGVYDFRAVARDSRGGIDASRILRGRRVDNLAPTVAMLEPGAGALLRGEIPLSARASDAGSGVRSVLFQFSADGATWRPIVTRTESAGAVYWDTTRVADADYQLRAVVGDGAGNLTTSDPIAIRIDNTPPAVSLDEPAGGGYLGGAIRLRASAADPGSGVIAVRFEWSHDGIAWGEIGSAAAEPYAAVWDTTRTGDGVYRLRAVARDRAGNGSFTEPVELTVANTLVFAERPAEPAPVAPEPAVAPEPEPEPAPVKLSIETVSLWQLERLLEQHAAGHERREELEALLYTLRPYARPDGTIPERFQPLLWEAFGELL